MKLTVVILEAKNLKKMILNEKSPAIAFKALKLAMRTLGWDPDAKPVEKKAVLHQHVHTEVLQQIEQEPKEVLRFIAEKGREPNRTERQKLLNPVPSPDPDE